MDRECIKPSTYQTDGPLYEGGKHKLRYKSMYADSRFAMYRTLILLVFMVGTLPPMMAAYGDTERVEIDIPDKALSRIEKIVPARTFALFVSADTVPQSAEELRRFDLDVASGDGAVSAPTIAQELGMSGSAQGAGPRDYIQYKTLLVIPRADDAPPYVVEVVLK